MNTSKNNLDYQIKKQIEEREITPSRDLWSEIETQNHAVSDTQTKKINWFLVAACLMLMISLGAVLIFNEDRMPDMHVTQKKTSTENPELKPDSKNSPGIIQQNLERDIDVKNVASSMPEKMKTEVITKKQQNLPVIKENFKEMAIQISQVPAEKILAKTDSAKVQVKKKRYVDPSTLLFSVEHKDVIEKTKDGSNVARVDLNSK